MIGSRRRRAAVRGDDVDPAHMEATAALMLWVAVDGCEEPRGRVRLPLILGARTTIPGSGDRSGLPPRTGDDVAESQHASSPADRPRLGRRAALVSCTYPVTRELAVASPRAYWIAGWPSPGRDAPSGPATPRRRFSPPCDLRPSFPLPDRSDTPNFLTVPCPGPHRGRLGAEELSPGCPVCSGGRWRCSQLFEDAADCRGTHSTPDSEELGLDPLVAKSDSVELAAR
jgi:hypothetical protein